VISLPDGQVKSSLLEPEQLAPQDPLQDEEVADRKIDRKLRRGYAIWVLAGTATQLLIMDVAVIAYGIVTLRRGQVIDVWSVRAYLLATLAQVFGIVLVIAKYLFPRQGFRG
jgi:hypothetical protein